MTTNDAPGRRPGATPATGQRDWLAEARQAYADGDGNRAIYAAREALALDGSNHAAWSIRSQSSFALERYTDAEFEAREALRLAPDVAEYHWDLASVYEVQERSDDAIREYREAMRLDPSVGKYEAGIGSVYLAQERTSDAIAIYERLVNQHPSEPVFRLFLARALDEDIRVHWTLVPGGDRVLTAPDQIALTRTNAKRGLALDFRDNEIRTSLKQSLAAADQAEQRRWTGSMNMRWYVGAVVLGLIVAISGIGSGGGTGVLIGLLGLVLVALAILLFVRRHHKLVWGYDAALAARQLSQARR